MTQSDFPLPLDGGCRCGTVRYQVTSAPAFIFACHCTDCRQLTAGAFSIGMPVPKEGLRSPPASRESGPKIADSGKPSHQYWCPILPWLDAHDCGGFARDGDRKG